jgi:hypothetical protein
MNVTQIAQTLAVLVMTNATSASAQAPAVTGAWTRVAIRDSSGKTLQLPNAHAFVIFSADGFFSQSVIPTGRPSTTVSGMTCRSSER